jgi:epidermal growth factor receptor kinase substrate 8
MSKTDQNNNNSNSVASKISIDHMPLEENMKLLNKCFDDIEVYIAHVQAQSSPTTQTRTQLHFLSQYSSYLSSKSPLQLLVDILQKFKLSFNLLAKLKNHIHEPNAPELLHFLFTPLTVILDACQWGLGRNIAPQIVSPLLARETKELMQNCLTSKESDVWMALGDTWRTPPEDWPGPLPQPYRPVFADGFMPYGPPVGLDMPGRHAMDAPRQHHQPPPVHVAHRGRSVDNVS